MLKITQKIKEDLRELVQGKGVVEDTPDGLNLYLYNEDSTFIINEVYASSGKPQQYVHLYCDSKQNSDIVEDILDSSNETEKPVYVFSHWSITTNHFSDHRTFGRYMVPQEEKFFTIVDIINYIKNRMSTHVDT